MPKVLITGGAGFIGAAIAKELLKDKEEIVLYDAFLNFIDPVESNYETLLKLRLKDVKDKVNLIRGDVRYKDGFMDALKRFSPDVVVHLAALPIASISSKYSEDAFGINLNGTVNVLESIRLVDSVKRFIYASSSMVYGNFQYSPADENHPVNPIDVYGGTKLAGEILTKSYGNKFNLEYTIIRPSAVYGPTDANRRVSQIFVEDALKGKAIKLEGGGTSKLDFTYVEDVAKGFVLAMKSERAVNETFNITKGEGRSIREFANILKGIIPGLKVDVAPIDVKRPERGALDISKAKKLLGYKPLYSLEEGLKIYVDFIKQSGIIK